jgi:putative membrane protein
MEAFGASVAFAPDTALAALAFVAAGIALGTLSGLVPGLHANNFALLMAAAAASVPGPPRLVGTAMLAAGVVHTFLDVVPALALGVPDAAMAASALPGHRLVIEGRGREALRLSALGSGLAVLLAVPLALPMARAMVAVYPTIRANLPLVLGAVAAFLILTERTNRRRVGGALAFGASAGLGWLLLDVESAAPLSVGGMLMPLFAGLFGAPVLIEAIGGAGVPPQGDAGVTSPRRTVGLTAVVGAVSGAIVGYLPGVSAAVAATVTLPAVPREDGARGFLVATSGVNTSNTILALFALVALGAPRTGVLVALDSTGVPLDLPLLLAAVGIAAAVAFVLVPLLGDRYLRTVGRADYTRLSVGVLCLLIALAYLFAGSVGVGAFAAATVVGLVPPRFGARRVHLMGVLMGPLIAGV